MYSALAIILPLALVAAAPIPGEDARRGLLNLSPVISPKLSATPGCFGMGIAQCNPVNVAGQQNTGSGGIDNGEKTQPSSNGNSLINVAPVVDPDIALGGGCVSFGIAGCNPVNVNGDQNNGA
ncbi:hypothetical protein HJFPF1_00281 [Paramyrothecium foliicola]|nr:hypothetical protein HJFPF1_00281 [Paramyrothecium foliicola]